MANAATNTMTNDELLAPLASMEDLSVLMTPMSTPGPSPRSRARWSHRSSTGSQYEPFMASPLTASTMTGGAGAIPKREKLHPLPEEYYPSPPPRKTSNNSLLKLSLESRNNNGSATSRFVTPYKHDPTVMNADFPQPPVSFRRQQQQRPPKQPAIDEAEEFLLQDQELQPRQVQFLTPRTSIRNQNHHHQGCVSPNHQKSSAQSRALVSPEVCRYHEEFEEDQMKWLAEPKDRLEFMILVESFSQPLKPYGHGFYFVGITKNIKTFQVQSNLPHFDSSWNWNSDAMEYVHHCQRGNIACVFT
jgi:hypothetical protein